MDKPFPKKIKFAGSIPGCSSLSDETFSHGPLVHFPGLLLANFRPDLLPIGQD